MAGFDYRKAGSTLWTGATGRWLRKQPAHVTVVAFYLFTCPSSTQWGLFYLPRVYIANDTGRTLAEVDEALDKLEKHGFCRYDAEAEVVWVVNMCRDQVGEIRGGDKRAKPAQEAARELLEMPFGAEWYRHYETTLGLPPCPINAPLMGHGMGHPSAPEAPSMPHPESADAPSMPEAGSGAGEKQERLGPRPPLALSNPEPKKPSEHHAFIAAFDALFHERTGGPATWGKVQHGQLKTLLKKLGLPELERRARRLFEGTWWFVKGDEVPTLDTLVRHIDTLAGGAAAPSQPSPPPSSSEPTDRDARFYLEGDRWFRTSNLAEVEQRLEDRGVPIPWWNSPIRAQMTHDVGRNPLKPVKRAQPVPLKSIPGGRDGENGGSAA